MVVQEVGGPRAPSIWAAERTRQAGNLAMPRGRLRADREPPTAFSLGRESAPVAHDVPGKVHGLAPIIGLVMHESTVPLLS